MEAETLHLHTDASGTLGYGAIFGSKCFFCSWPSHLADYAITLKELFPQCTGCRNLEYNRCIVLHTDNTAVMHIINNQSAKVPIIMTLVRKLVLACMYHNVLVKAEHIPGKENT